MKKPPLLFRVRRIVLCLVVTLFVSSYYLVAQTYIGAASAPADNSAQAGPTVTVNPSGVGTMQAGDLVIIYAHYRANSGTLSISQTGGQTWFQAVNSASNNQSMAVFWCRYNGMWSANPSVTVGTGTSGMSAIMYVFRPTNSSYGWLVNGTTAVQTTNNTSVQVTGHATTLNNAVAVAFWSSPAANTYGSLTSGWTKPGSTQYRNTQAASNQSHSAAYKVVATAGGTGAVTQVLNSTQQTKECMVSWAEGPMLSNDDCVNATTLTPTGVCSPTAGSLFYSTVSNPAGTSCTNRSDVWYKFTLPSNPEANFATITVALTSDPSTLTTNNTYVELFNANACPVSSPMGGCNNISSQSSYLNLTPGGTYYFRINTSANPNTNPSQWNFNVCVTTFQPTAVGSGRMNEVFRQTVLSPASILADPWEITYGSDNYLWITESKGYKVYRMDPATGAKTTVLDISQGSTFLPLAERVFNCQFANGNGAQGGLAGLALHPKFLDPVSPENYVYVSYVYRQDSAWGGCRFFTNRLVRFTYNTSTQLLESPVSLCDTLPGSSDHNSQRIIIAPVGSKYYLFYGSGDMGAGQFDCRLRPIRAQSIHSYEGKILRFNVDTDEDSPTLTALNNWIPNDNPYNGLLGKQSAVWSTGIRNNQGFAYDPVLDILYGSSHGPYSDDEINIIKPFRNYGHPIVIGYASDGNYNGTATSGTRNSISAGAPYPTAGGVSSIDPVGNELARKAEINAKDEGAYHDPLFSAYAVPSGDTFTEGTIRYIWRYAPHNSTPAPGWPSEAWSGLDLYNHSMIPGWKKSLIAASLKWGRLVRLKLGKTGVTTMPSNDSINNENDTISYFGSQNRFRDLAIAPNGKDIYVIMDRSTTTSGPSALFPTVPACQGCVQKYTFMGYNVNTGDHNKSYIPSTIEIARGVNNNCDIGNTVTINNDNANTNIWVPITDTSSNIIGEIYAQGQELGDVTTRVYHNANAIRSKNGRKYLDRNITITPQNQPSGDVRVRLYITEEEYLALRDAGGSGITTPADVVVFKNNDECGAVMDATPTAVNMDFQTESFSDGYVLQGRIGSFSTFYFGSSALTTLPLDLVTFTGVLQSNNTVSLKWTTENERNVSHFVVERSTNGSQFAAIGSVAAQSLSSSHTVFNYTHIDLDAASQSSLILYYRLKIVDIDGSIKYSDIVVININAVTGRATVSPNPTEGLMNISLPSALNEKANWKLMDNAGRVLMQSAIQLRTGANNWSVDIRKLAAGTYYLVISGSATDQRIKIQKL